MMSCPPIDLKPVLAASFSPVESPGLGRWDRVDCPGRRGGPATAWLGPDGAWHCPEIPALDRALNLLHAPGRPGSGDLDPRQAALVRAAGWLKGTARAGVDPPPDR